MTRELAANSLDTTLRAIAITGGRDVPSRRFRIKALVPFLMQSGILLDELCPIVSRYPPSNHLYRLPWFAAAIAERLSYVWRATGYDVVILQRELISTIATLEDYLPQPRILDVDDAIYLRRDGVAAKKIAGRSLLVVCGNAYLAEEFSKWNRKIAIIPTGVDTDNLKPRDTIPPDDEPIIGWIGTPTNFSYLKKISTALTRVLQVNPHVSLHIVSSTYPEFLGHLGNRLVFHRWKPEIENELLPKFTVGIMPLVDDEWSRGKCAFKMLQYMAAGLPVVVSPVGMNAELLRADVGVGAVTSDDWSESLLSILDNQQEQKRMGDNGRRLVVSDYSLSAIALLWKKQLSRIV